ncbi:alpha/beta fold hydrolase [Tautonia rosea]|uniref:alpha/beta fold hydrolase n=1 Tax=Tautonia rosea TaxID=2728037 RepID=UPI0014747AE0|nr:alpha/beta fold hydrolase [Tautonia rosea]
MAPSIVLKAALLLGGVHPAPTIEPSEFQDLFLASYDGTLELDESLAKRIQGFRYIFVLGLMNERSPGYLDQNVRELEAMGVPSNRIHRIAPSSNASFRENLDEIRAAFKKVADQGPEPLVVIGHSRGACDALAFALHEAEFVSERVIALFLVQGPFGGSGAADYVLGSGVPMDRKISPPARALANLFRNAAARKLERGKHSGIVDLTSDASDHFWKRLLASRRSAIPIVSPRTFYIEATVPPSRQPPFRRPVARYLEAYYGPNDGLVAAGDQYLPELGTRLGILEVSHMDLTHRFPAGRPQRRLRGALVQAIVVAVARLDEADRSSVDQVSQDASPR